LGSASDPKNRKVNATIFEGYHNDLQESITNTWRVTPEAITQYQGIANFKATRHAMWIQAWKYPDNQWLQLRYCIKEVDIEMAIKDWDDNWRIPVLNREIPTEMEEEEVRQEQTHAEEITVPKKPRTGQNKVQQKKGGVSKKGTQVGKKNNTQAPQVQEKQTETTQGTTSSATQQEQGQTKRPVIQMGGACKKAKAHRMPPEYMITEDDADMVAQMVQDRTVEDFDNVECQRDRIEEEMAYMRQLLQQLREAQVVDNSVGTVPSTSQIGGEVGSSEQDRIQMTTQPSSTFHVTPNMLCMDEIVGKTPLKDLAQIQLVLMWIPTKALYKLQVNVTQEVQSRACTDAVELQQEKDNRDELELVLEQAKLETKDEKYRMDRLEQELVVAYEKIPKSAQMDRTHGDTED
jgi:hypothetical protein